MEQLIQGALAAGAYKAVVFDAERIALSAQFRDICRSNQCGKFGKCWMCPPCLPAAQAAIEKVKSYSKVLWYQSVASLEDSFDIEGMMEAGKNHALLGQRIQKLAAGLLPEGFLHLSCGGCHLCQRCAKEDDLPCRMPHKALPALEGYCVDVYNTTKDTPLSYINGQNTVTYFGAILY